MLKEIAYTLYSYTVAHPVQTQVIVLVALLVYYLVVYPVTSLMESPWTVYSSNQLYPLLQRTEKRHLDSSCARVA